jgi:hypothetical protein
MMTNGIVRKKRKQSAILGIVLHEICNLHLLLEEWMNRGVNRVILENSPSNQNSRAQIICIQPNQSKELKKIRKFKMQVHW